MARYVHTRLVLAAGAVLTALVLVVAGGVIGRAPASQTGAAPTATTIPAVGLLERRIAQAQHRLHAVPGDWRTWAALSIAYLDQARAGADPSYYAKAEQAVRRSLAIRPETNTEALVALGALANARHDFAAARRHALAAITTNAYHADAYAVLADAQTQLGHAGAATATIQRLLDLRPGLPAYARASYDLEQRGRVGEATALMRHALAVAVDRRDVGFCRAQLGDLALAAGDAATAQREYAAGLAADPSALAPRRGLARAAAARGQLDEAVAGYAALTDRAPTPQYLLEYAELLRAAGQGTQAAAALELAGAAHQLFTAGGGVDGLTGSALALADGEPARAVLEARAEWMRRTHADVADALGWALHRAGRDGEALGYARRAVGSGARSASYAYHLGMIELSLGDHAAARAHLTQALAINPRFSPLDAPLARRALAGLGS